MKAKKSAENKKLDKPQTVKNINKKVMGILMHKNVVKHQKS